MSCPFAVCSLLKRHFQSFRIFRCFHSNFFLGLQIDQCAELTVRNGKLYQAQTKGISPLNAKLSKWVAWYVSEENAIGQSEYVIFFSSVFFFFCGGKKPQQQNLSNYFVSVMIRVAQILVISSWLFSLQKNLDPVLALPCQKAIQ